MADCWRFAVCLVSGRGIEADNTFATTVERALMAMVGDVRHRAGRRAMAQKMLEENVKHRKEKLKNSEAKSEPSDR